MNSKCKWSCGFIIEQRHFMNPVDFALVYASKYFPLDYLFFAMIVIYIFICSFYGIIKVGIRANFFKVKACFCLPFQLLSSKSHMKSDQSALFRRPYWSLDSSSRLWSFLFRHKWWRSVHNTRRLVLKNTMTSSARWTTCQGWRILAGCLMFQLFSIGNEPIIMITSSHYKLNKCRISVSLPFFSTIFFVGNLCFLGLSAIFLLNALCRKKADRFEVLSLSKAL